MVRPRDGELVREKTYISGQITGLTHDEYTDLFAKAEAWLIDNGHEPVNPLKVVACPEENCNEDAAKPDGSYLHSWRCYMRFDIIEMLRCDNIFMLLNYENSTGAKLELFVAERVGMRVIYQQHIGVWMP